MDFDKLLKFMVEKGASDLFITAGVPPSAKLNGRMTPLTRNPLGPEQAKEIVTGVMNADQREEFDRHQECNFAIASRVGRFRVSAFQQRNMCGMVLRRIETNIPSCDDLNLPDILKELAMTKRGLIIFVGATGTGKSTSLAAMVDHRNRNSKGHIITIEDPIEFVHQHKGCIVTQREVGVDTESFGVALKNTLRQAPDVILLGEVRSKETMDYALQFAETGHLALCTLHANNANQALDRIIHFFPADRHEQTWMDLSLNLKAIIAQQLVPTKDGTGRRAAIEILINTPLISDTIRKGDVHVLKSMMTDAPPQSGMQTFDQALYKLYAAGEIDYDVAISSADSPNDLRLMIKMGVDQDSGALDDISNKLSLEENFEDDSMTMR
ncbi:MAG: PilT/PilU family type 4a pilus ATPase [Pseudomonadales bacterium]|nr:PilT/PilU family type 4a pilus ATPase [Pseudomonadales bacterium]